MKQKVRGLLVLLTSVYGISLDGLASDRADLPPLRLAIHVLENSGWTSEEMSDLTQHSKRAFAHCGIHLSFSYDAIPDPDGRYQRLARQEENGLELEIVRLAKDPSALNAYLTKYHENILGPEAGKAVRWVPDLLSSDILHTVWISRDPLHARYQGTENPMPIVLSHEIGHILGLEHSYKRNDIMDGGPHKGTLFRKEQCKILRPGLIRFSSKLSTGG